MYNIVRPLLFSLPPEMAHTLSLRALKYMPACCFKPIASHAVQVMGLNFPNQFGIAAGLDKNGEYLDALAKLGFAFIEIGTVTPRAQSGNPKPRLFRIHEKLALINRMGFNNHGVHTMVENLKKSQYQGILGINIGKNKDTSLEHAKDDYIYCLQHVYPYANYITINISSPNTPDLRQLQQASYFVDLISALKSEREILSTKYKRYVPLLVKISPDETEETLKVMANSIVTVGLDGIIATNTTCSRDGVKGLKNSEESGGLSGAPLFARSTTCLQLLRQIVGNDLTLIGVGGITDKSTAAAKFNAGANLVQVYSGLVYFGLDFMRS